MSTKRKGMLSAITWTRIYSNLYNAEYGEADSDISEGGLICEEDDCDFEVQPDELEDFCTNVSTRYNNIIQERV